MLYLLKVGGNMEDRVLEAIIRDIFNKGGNFDIREVSLDDEFIPNDMFEYIEHDMQRHYSIQLLNRIKEKILSGEISFDVADGIIKNIIKYPDNIYEQEHVFSNLTFDYNARIYLNPAMGEGYYKFIEEFVIRSLKSNIRFRMKPYVYDVGVTKVKDKMVIYTTTDYLEQASNICLEIFKDFPELQKQFGIPPYGTVTPNPYFGVCQNVTKSKFKMDTYNDYFNGVAMQGFVHLMLSNDSRIKKLMIKKLGREVIEDFMNFKMHYVTKGKNFDVVSTCFFEQPQILEQLKFSYGNKFDSLASSFYERIKKIHSVHIYGDTKHPSHPAITDDIKFLEKYVNDNKVDFENVDVLNSRLANTQGIPNGVRPAGDLEPSHTQNNNSLFQPAGDLEPSHTQNNNSLFQPADDLTVGRKRH